MTVASSKSMEAINLFGCPYEWALTVCDELLFDTYAEAVE